MHGLTILLFFLSKRVSCGGPFAYCCDIAKCHGINEACISNAIIVNGRNCQQACINDPYQGFDCTVVDPRSLNAANYSCFEPYLRDDASQPLLKTCVTSYSSSSPPTPDLPIDYGFCCQNCWGWTLSNWSQPSQWATPLLQYILPAVIFSMTIPRRRRWEVGDRFFNFKLNRVEGIFKAVVSLIIAGIVVVADTSVWVFTIFTMAGPMLVGGLQEAIIDYCIVAHLDHIGGSPNKVHFLSYPERVELMIVILCGNLDLGIGDPQRLLNEHIGLPNNPFSRLSIQETDDNSFAPTKSRLTAADLDTSHWDALVRRQVELESILTCQYSFGSIVGAPVLFYLGSFIYTVAFLEDYKGDNAQAHSLGFGMWWMGLVHVSIVSGCLLASNNPSTSSALVGKKNDKEDEALRRLDSFTMGSYPSSTQESNAKPSSNRSGISSRIAGTMSSWVHFGMSPVFSTRFRPVPLWGRGQMKMKWLENTLAWQRHDWLSRKLGLEYSWIMIAVTAFLLILIPTTMGLLVSYNTPRKGVSCRSFTFLLYAICQFVLIIAATWRGASPDSFSLSRHVPSQKSSRMRAGLVACFKITALILMGLALIGATFSGFAGTLMQILNVYGNCLCAIPVVHWANPWGQTFLINPDSAQAREASNWWRFCGFAAIGFMAVVCYGGWWYQRFLRHKFLAQVAKLDARRTLSGRIVD